MSRSRISLTHELFVLLKEVSKATAETNKKIREAASLKESESARSSGGTPKAGILAGLSMPAPPKCKVSVTVEVNGTSVTFNAERQEAGEWLKLLFGEEGRQLIHEAGSTYHSTYRSVQ